MRHIVHVDRKYQSPQVRAREETLNPTLRPHSMQRHVCKQSPSTATKQ